MSDFSFQQQKGNGRGRHPNSIAAGTANLIPYKPGQSGNPGGNYKHTPKFRNAYERLLQMSPEERKKYRPQNGVEELALAQIERGIAAKEDRDRITATEKVMDRVEGRAVGRKEINRLDVQVETSLEEYMKLLAAANISLDEREAAEVLEVLARVEGEE